MATRVLQSTLVNTAERLTKTKILSAINLALKSSLVFTLILRLRIASLTFHLGLCFTIQTEQRKIN